MKKTLSITIIFILITLAMLFALCSCVTNNGNVSATDVNYKSEGNKTDTIKPDDNGANAEFDDKENVTTDTDTTEDTSKDTSEDTTQDTSKDTSEDTDDTVDNVVGDSESTDSVCSHKNTTLINTKESTCSEQGYSGDSKCILCNKIVVAGEVIPAKGHGKTKIIGVVNATCIEQGYTGDKICTVCNDTIEKGKFTPTIAHDVQLVGRVEPTTTSDGYSGDMICLSCGLISEHGVTLPKIQTEIPLREVIRTEDGKDYHFWIPVDGDGFDYTIEKCDKRYTSPYAAIEERILYLVNIERAKVGAAPLTMEKRAAYFTHIRGVECIETFSHKRPDGRRWTTVYYDEGVYVGCVGENLAKTYGLYEVYGEDYDVAAHFVNMWMKSDSHREAMLNPGYKSISINVTIENNVFVGVQHFFG